jgi:hypothetical protein
LPGNGLSRPLDMEGAMTRFFAGVLSVIAVGVLLVAYGLLKPGAAAYGWPYGVDQFGRPVDQFGNPMVAVSDGMMPMTPATSPAYAINPRDPHGSNSACSGGNRPRSGASAQSRCRARAAA